MEKPRQGRPLAVGPQRWEPGRVAAAPDSPQPVHLVQAQGLTHLQGGDSQSGWHYVHPPCSSLPQSVVGTWGLGSKRDWGGYTTLFVENSASGSSRLSFRAECGSKKMAGEICVQAPRPIPTSAPGAEDSSSTDCVFSLPATAPFILSPVT